VGEKMDEAYPSSKTRLISKFTPKGGSILSSFQLILKAVEPLSTKKEKNNDDKH
jgi:hypothetical protein